MTGPSAQETKQVPSRRCPVTSRKDEGARYTRKSPSNDRRLVGEHSTSARRHGSWIPPPTQSAPNRVRVHTEEDRNLHQYHTDQNDDEAITRPPSMRRRINESKVGTFRPSQSNSRTKSDCTRTRSHQADKMRSGWVGYESNSLSEADYLIQNFVPGLEE